MELTIRNMRAGDLEALAGLLSDPEVMEHLEAPFTREKSRQFLEAAGLSDPPRIYAVEQGGQLIGYVIYHDYDADSKEIGWVLKRDAWGKGFAKALTRRLVGRAWAEGKSVILECAPEQRVSRHIAEQAGFSYIGRAEGCDVYRLEQEAPR